MGIEIERKFLVKDNFVKNMIYTNKYNNKINIKQGYITNSPEKVVRVRISNNNAYLTIKGKNDGPSRLEFEYDISLSDAEHMIENMCENIIEKIRYIFKISDDIWEVDVFGGNNDGLIVAEAEIPSIDYPLSIPEWIKMEVTDDIKYYNNNLSINPYTKWN